MQQIEVENQEFYHFHRADAYPHLWHEGNTIITDSSFVNDRYRLLKNYRTYSIATDDQKVDELENMLFNDLEIEYKDKIKIIAFTQMIKSELAMEEYRKNNCPHINSRFNSIYLTDENSLKFWRNSLQIYGDFHLYKVRVSGKIFKSNPKYYPDGFERYDDIVPLAKLYWEHDYEEPPSYGDECLFTGTLFLEKKLM